LKQIIILTINKKNMRISYKISKEGFLEFTKNQPKTPKELAKHFKVTETTIYNLLKKHNLPKNILSRQKKTILTIKTKKTLDKLKQII